MKPDPISPEAFKAAWKCAETVLRNLPDDYGDVSLEIEAIARAIDAAVAAEREACARTVEALDDADSAFPYAAAAIRQRGQ